MSDKLTPKHRRLFLGLGLWLSLTFIGYAKWLWMLWSWRALGFAVTLVMVVLTGVAAGVLLFTATAEN